MAGHAWPGPKQPGAEMTVFCQNYSKMHFLKQPGEAMSIFWSWSNFGQDFGQTEQQKQQHSLQQQRGAHAKRARPFAVSVPSVVSVVLFDQNLDQKIDLGWPGLAWVKPWAGPGQALGWARVKPWAGPWSSPGKNHVIGDQPAGSSGRFY